jgi:hypothetical protein
VPAKPGSKAFRQAMDQTMAREAQAAKARPVTAQRRVARPATQTTRTAQAMQSATIGRQGYQGVTTAKAAAKARDVDTGRKRSNGLGCLLMLLIVIAVIVFFVLRGVGGNLSGLFG